MPFMAGIVNSGGNLPEDVQRRLTPFVASVDKQVERLAREKGLLPSQVRLLRPCNVAYIVTEDTIFAVLTNINVGGMPMHRYIHRTEGQMNLHTAIYLVERDLAFEQAFGIQFSRTFIEDDTNRETHAIEVAQSYLADEIINLERLNKIVRLNPVFNGRDFMIDDSLVFVLSPFSEPFDTIHRDHIQPTVEAISGLRCLRADDIYDNRPIIEDIWRLINEARIIIAELSGRNPNVFYETGIAHTVGKEVILLTQNIEDVPFDLRHLRSIVYDYTPRGVSTLETNLRNTILTIINRSH